MEKCDRKYDTTVLDTVPLISDVSEEFLLSKTVNSYRSQGLPPEPVDAERSITKLSHLPMIEGATITTLGSSRYDGTSIDTFEGVV
jgi:hypothetical protein